MKFNRFFLFVFLCVIFVGCLNRERVNYTNKQKSKPTPTIYKRNNNNSLLKEFIEGLKAIMGICNTKEVVESEEIEKKESIQPQKEEKTKNENEFSKTEKKQEESHQELTFVAIKPDGVQRGLMGEIMGRYEKKGFKIVGMRMIYPQKELIENHYKEHLGKEFYPKLINYLTSGPVIALAIKGKDAISQIRKINGATNPCDAAIGTIRGDLAIDSGRNLVHSSDSKESAERELSLWFKEEEIIEFRKCNEDWVYE